MRPRPQISGYQLSGLPNKLFSDEATASGYACSKAYPGSSASGTYQGEVNCLVYDPSIPDYYTLLSGMLVGETVPSPNPPSLDPTTLDEQKPGGTCVTDPVDGDPITISTRQSIQTEVDYVGGGRYPLKFVRTFASQRQDSNDDDAPGLWNHNYSMTLHGALPGAPVPIRPAISTRNPDGSWSPAPFYDGADGGVRSVIANRPNGKHIYFQLDAQLDGLPDSDISSSLQAVTLTDGNPGVKLTNNNDESEFYDVTGRLVSIQSRTGDSHTLNYDAQTGLLSSVSDGFGSTLDFTYDTDGRIDKLMFPDNTNYVQYTYTTKGGYGSASYPWASSARLTRTYHYEDTNNARLLTGITDERNKRYITWEYDSDGYATKSTNPNDVGKVTFVKESDGRITTTNALGKKTKYDFDIINGSSRLVSVEGVASANCAANVRNITYDSNGYRDTSTDVHGTVTSYNYNDRGLQTERKEAFGSIDERIISTLWHASFNLPTKITHPLYTIEVEYDAQGNVDLRTYKDTLTNETRIWDYGYDASGRLESVDGPRTDVADVTSYIYYNCTNGGKCGQLKSITNAINQVTTISVYDAHGMPKKIIDPNGIITLLYYDRRQRLTRITTDSKSTSIAYHKNGTVYRVTLPDGTYLKYYWDTANRLIKILDKQNNQLYWNLDKAGNRRSEKRKNSSNVIEKRLDHRFDELNRLIKTTYSHGGTTGLSYDDATNTVTQTDALQRTTVQSFDALKRLINIEDALLGNTSIGYNKLDKPSTVTDPEGLTTSYTYNGFGDILTIDSPDAGLTTNTYDSAGNLLSRLNARGVLTTYVYDKLNRLTHVNYPTVAENIVYTYDQGINAKGHLNSISDHSGSRHYTYDARGNVKTVTIAINNQTYVIAYDYTDANRIEKITYPSGRQVNYTFDDSGRVDSVVSTHNGSAETLASNIQRLPFGPTTGMMLGNGVLQTKTYDKDYLVDNLMDGSILDRTYQYTSLNQVDVVTDTISSSLSQSFDYDELNRLEKATGGGYGVIDYDYDGVGNRLSRKQVLSGSTTNDIYNYTNSDSHHLSSITGGAAFTYDAVGNVTAKAGTTFTYNNRDRMKSAKKGAVTTTYTYNALGQRVIKSTPVSTHIMFLITMVSYS